MSLHIGKQMVLACLFAGLATLGSQAQADSKVQWKKSIVDKVFRSEGVAVADVNKDGKNDILVGEVWYEAPTWKVHVIREDRSYTPKGYSNCFACWPDDINQDGWQDLVVVGFPGKPAYWYANPQNKPGPWKEHMIWHSACNETPLYVDLFGNGQRVLVMGFQPKEGDVQNRRKHKGQMAYFSPGSDPTKLWHMHPISQPSQGNKRIPGTFRFDHGLGVADVNGDGRKDVLCTGGWWEQPNAVKDSPWTFHAADLGPACADMFALDVDGDGVNDVVSSSAHNFGIWWHRQDAKKKRFVRRLINNLEDFKLFSQSHALHLVDINGDGLKDLVTGRRRWAHNGRDPGGNDAPYLYWFETKKQNDGSLYFQPHRIDDDSGIGTQFVVIDFDGDGDLDIVVSNKRGVFVTLQVGETQPAARREQEN